MSPNRHRTRTRSRLRVLLPLIAAATTMTVAGPGHAQPTGNPPVDPAPALAGIRPTLEDTIPYRLAPLVVTATRTARPVFTTPAPVNVIGATQIRAAAASTVSDLFREAPGLDVAGVGVQQPRPVIRGQRGQRILLLQDGVRFNNSRRQQDFGEIPGLVDVSTVERVEVVRGPSSVLYGTDAIGGVINIITRTPERDGVHGTVGYRYGSAGEQKRGAADVFGRFGGFDFQLNAALREVGSYDAPSGSFGNVSLASPVAVHGTGVEDRTLAGRLGYRFHPNHSLFVRAEQYDAHDAGYGFVEPADYDPTQRWINITYPDQTFRKLSFGYSGTQLRTPIADRADIIAYTQQNERNLGIELKLQQGAMHVDALSYSDVGSRGLRFEAKKLALPRVLLTYGVDVFRDRAVNRDSATVTMTMNRGGQTMTVTQTDTTQNMPADAAFRSLAAFVQSEVSVGRGTVVLGTRVQDAYAEASAFRSRPETTETKNNRTVVGSASVIYPVTEGFSVLGSVGRGFRSPNLIEWFFEGPVTDRSYFQSANLELKPETSLNTDFGLRFRTQRINLEGFVFQNRIRDGIRTAPTGETKVLSQREQYPEYRNVNIDRLTFRGVEINGDVALALGFAVAGSYTQQEATDARDAAIPVGDLYSSKAIGAFRYRSPAGRLWAEYGVRHNGEQTDSTLVNHPVGDVLPAFTVQHLRGGVTVFQRGGHAQRLGVTVGNLANRLYAESANVNFFRPEPGRHVIVSWEASF
jgi:hemoglobin/transferrin/lactoferrin receptor protein